MRSRTGTSRRIGVIALGMVAAVGLAACGSSSSSSSSSGGAQQLLRETFGGHHAVKSGILSFSLTLTPSGSSTLSGPISFSLNGPFQSRGSGKLPESDFTIALDAAGHHGQLGLISTGTSAYITLNGKSYQLPASDYDKLASGFTQTGSSSSAGGLARFGIEPLHWVTNPSIVGNETIAGSSTTHIHAGIDVAALLGDLNTLLHKASATGASSKIPASISQAAREKIADSVRNPIVDVWTGSSDHTLRKLSLSLGFPVSGQISTELGGLNSATVGMTLQYAELNQPQTISAPANVQPFSSLQGKLAGILQQSEGAGALGLLGASGSSGSGSSSSGLSASGSSPRGIAKYTKCIQDAGDDVGKMQKCASLLNGSGG